MDHVVIYTDGSSRGNPGCGGYGSVLLFVDHAGNEHKLELSAGFDRTTNNRMELMACIRALEALKRPCDVELHSDSKYVVNAFRQNWIAGWQLKGWRGSNRKPVKNYDLWQRLVAAAAPHRINWIWVKGHAGTRYNERCDELATMAADDTANHQVDEGYIQNESLF